MRRKIFFDTNLFLYLLEGQNERAARVSEIVQGMSERQDELLTSTLTLAEVLVKPIGNREDAWAEKYEKLLITPGVTIVAFDKAAARIYARVRQDKTIQPHDAIQLSCAASAKCDLFITNDDRLSRKVVPGIQFIASLERTFI